MSGSATIISQLSSQVGDKTEGSNLKVVRKCLSNPELLKEIAEGLKSKDVRLVGDCAEVFTKTAEKVYPYLVRSLDVWGNKHTHRNLAGLKNVVRHLPKLKGEIKKIAEKYQNHPRGVLKKAAKQLLKEISN